MKKLMLKKKLKIYYRRIGEKFRPITKRLHFWLENWSGKVNLGITKPQVFAYNILGEKTAKLLPLFRDLDKNLEKSNIKINFKAYVSLTILSSLISSALTLILVPMVLYLFLGISLFPALLFGLGFSMLSGALTTIGFYFYPVYKADNLKRKLESELPFITGYMSVLASSGVTPEKIFLSIARMNFPLAITEESKRIIRDVELFGTDIISALERASERSPSEEFKNFLEGFIATIHSGGNLVAYLSERSKQYMKLKKVALKKFADTLSILSEFYVAVLVAGPLLFVIMLSVMSMLGGGGVGPLDPKLLLYLLTYIGIPVASTIFMIILDVISPR